MSFDPQGVGGEAVRDYLGEIVPKSTVPPGASGEWSVSVLTVTDEEAKHGALYAAFHGGRGHTPAGEYRQLRCGRALVMSDTHDERRDLYGFVLEAEGSVLVTGLGLGVCAAALLRKDEVCGVTVIEREADVIALVAPHLARDKLSIIHADAFTWKPPKGSQWDFAWHDIWPNICADNLPEMHCLHRRYGRRAKQQRSWCRAETERCAL